MVVEPQALCPWVSEEPLAWVWMVGCDQIGKLPVPVRTLVPVSLLKLELASAQAQVQAQVRIVAGGTWKPREQA